VFLEDVIIPIVRLTSWIGKMLGKSVEDEKKISQQVYDASKDDRSGILKFLFPGPGQSPMAGLLGVGDSETEKFLRRQAEKLKAAEVKDVGLGALTGGVGIPGFSGVGLESDLDRRLAEMNRRRTASVWAADPRMSPFNPNRFDPQGPAQIPEGVLAPAYFQQDRAGKKLLGGMAGNELHEFNKRQKEINDARNFLEKNTFPKAQESDRSGFGPFTALRRAAEQGVKSTYEQIFDAELLDAFEKMEKAVGSNTKAQNAGAAAMKGSQEAIAAIARSENVGSQSPADRVARVMDEVRKKIEEDIKVSRAVIDHLKKPGIVVKEP
jgi:hypothetical protein